MPVLVADAEMAVVDLSMLVADDARPEGAPRRSAADRVYQALRQAILNGKLPSGTPLGEDAVGAELGVSRTPVREALLNLENEGLLEPGPRRVLIVRQATPELCEEVLTMRIALECEAVARACAVAGDEQLDRIRLTIFRQRRECANQAISDFLEADGQFHFAIANAAALPLVHKTLVQLHTFIQIVGFKALESPSRMEQAIVEHERVLDALVARDAAQARAAMRDHLEWTARVLDVGIRTDGTADRSEPEESRA